MTKINSNLSLSPASFSINDDQPGSTVYYSGSKEIPVPAISLEADERTSLKLFTRFDKFPAEHDDAVNRLCFHTFCCQNKLFPASEGRPASKYLRGLTRETAEICTVKIEDLFPKGYKF